MYNVSGILPFFFSFGNSLFRMRFYPDQWRTASRFRYVNTCAFNGLSCEFFSFFLKKNDTFNTRVIPESLSSSVLRSSPSLSFLSSEQWLQTGNSKRRVYMAERTFLCYFILASFFSNIHIIKLGLLYMIKKFFTLVEDGLINSFFFSVFVNVSLTISYVWQYFESGKQIKKQINIYEILVKMCVCVCDSYNFFKNYLLKEL